MLEEFAVDLGARQRHAAKSPQHHLRRRLRCRPSWLPRIDAFECSVCLLQIAPHDALYQHQHTQRDTPQADQGDAPLFVRQQQGRQRSGASWQPPEALFNQVRAAICGAPLGQAQRLGGVIGRLDTPAQAPHGVRERPLVARRPYTPMLTTHHGRRARSATAAWYAAASSGQRGLPCLRLSRVLSSATARDALAPALLLAYGPLSGHVPVRRRVQHACAPASRIIL